LQLLKKLAVSATRHHPEVSVSPWDQIAGLDSFDAVWVKLDERLNCPGFLGGWLV
jgi:hypothetical protein